MRTNIRWGLSAISVMTLLVVQPARLETQSRVGFATYLGSGLADGIVAIETDAAGNLHVFGTVPNAPTYYSFPHVQFFGPDYLPGAATSCYLAKFVPDGFGGLSPSYLAVLRDSSHCDAMTVAPSGEVFVARASDWSGTVIDSFSDASGGPALTRQFTLPHLAMTTRLRVDGGNNVYAMGVCAQEWFPGDLWPLPGGFQPGPAGQPGPCQDGSGTTPRTDGQHVLIAVRDTGELFYGTFFGFGTGQIDPTALEIDNSGLVYIAGHTNVGRGPTILTTANAFMSQPGDASCQLNAPGCEPGDAFLIVANPNLPGPPTSASLRYASYLGGTGRESDVAMALDDTGRVHVAGNTQSRLSFPGLAFSEASAIFELVVDVHQPPHAQFVRSSAIARGGTRLLFSHESNARFRLLPGGLSAFLAHDGAGGFPLVNPLYWQPRDPNASGDVNPLLLVHDSLSDRLVLGTYLDNANLAHRAHLASAANGTLYAGLLTTEQGRATNGASPLGDDDVLLLAISGIGAPTNSPPFALIAAERTLFANSGGGRKAFLYGGFSFDPDGDPLTYRWTEGATELGVGASVDVLLALGDHEITLTVDDGRGGTDTETVLIQVLPNTSPGAAVAVKRADASWVNFGIYNEFPVTIRFTNVTSTGITSVTSRYELPPVPPPGKQFGSPPLHFDVATTAAFSGAADVCVDYRGMSFSAAASALEIRQRVNGTWVAVPQANDTTARSICATVSSLGTFALFTPAAATNQIAILAGRPVRTTPCDTASGPDPNEGGLATDSFLCNTRGLAYDAARNYLYFAEAGGADKIRRLDLTTNLLTTVAGTGFPINALDGRGPDPRDDDRDNVDPRTTALNQVLALALDPAGNLYVAEYGEGRIRKIDFTQNRIFTVKALGESGQPSAMVLDASGALLFSSLASAGGFRIWRLTPGADGTVNGSADETLLAIAGNGDSSFVPGLVPAAGAVPSQIPIPANGLALGPDGSLYVTGYLGTAFALRITPGADGAINGVGDTAFLVGGGVFTQEPILGNGNRATSAQLYHPISIAVASNGDVYIGDTGNPRGATVRRIAAVDGEVTGAPDEIIEAIAGFHITDPQINAGNELPYSDGDGHALSSIFGAAFDLLVLPNGNVLVNDFYQVRRIGPAAGADTTAPVVIPPPHITVAATESIGARSNVPQAADTQRLIDLLAGGTATDNTDPAPVRLPTERVSCADPSSVSGTVAADTLFPIGRNCVRLPFQDAAGNIGYAVATFDVLPPVGAPVVAPGVAVAATDQANAPQPVTASFADVQQPGLLTAVPLASTVAPPVEFSFTSPAFDVRSTTLPFPAAAIVCVTLTGAQAGDRLLRLEAGAWTEVTATVDVASSSVCGSVAPLGIFATARLQPATVNVIERITVSDTPGLLPSALVGVTEQILVADAPLLQPSALLTVVEVVGVADRPSVAPQIDPSFSIALTPDDAQANAGEAVTWTASVTDSSDEETRVVIGSRTGDARVQFLQPSAANSPLAVSVTGVDVIVSLATNAAGGVSSTAADVASAINASPAASGLVVASTWIGRAGTGIVQPRPLTALSTIYIAVDGAPGLACFTTLPGFCSQSYTSPQPDVAEVIAFLDVDGNGSRGAGEPFAEGQATWVDGTPPSLTVPEVVIAVATSAAGATVSFDVSATDLVDGPVTVTCTPASGTTFAPGTTPVSCTAVDQAGNTGAGSFNVVVGTSTAAALELTSAPIFTPGGSGQFIASVTVGNDGIVTASDVAVAAAVLNGKSAESLPVQFGDIRPGERVTRQVIFPPHADPSYDKRATAIKGNMRMTFTWTGGSKTVRQQVVLPPAKAPLWGWVDLHTHPMSNLAFGGKLFHGAPDVGSLLPAVQMPWDPKCRKDVRAISRDEALSDDAPTHGDRFQSECGDFTRNALVQALEAFNHALRQPGHAVGSPTFVNWPKWNDITHQKMWIDWIRRARDGGLRVMVALSHNNRTLAELIGSGGPISGVRHDKGSSNLQIAEIKAFAARHPDLMQVALTPADLYQIVQAGKIAVILGVEVDNIGNFNDLPAVTPAMVEAEIADLYAQGVRYVFPVHLSDNVFGDTAIYSQLFNIANRRETGSFWTVGCASPTDKIGFRSLGFTPELSLFVPPGVPSPQAPGCTTSNGFFLGHVNARTPSGLTTLGEFAITAMMKRGMIVDVDHLSDRGVETALRLAEAVPFGGYPLVSGHSAVRDGIRFNAENARSRAQLQRIGCLQGMFGLGGDGAAAYQWASEYMDAFTEMGRPTAQCPNKSSLGLGRVAFGTDTNSLVSGPRPSLMDVKPGMAPRFTDIYNAANIANDNPLLPVLARSTTGLKTWDYNFHGVAHYGMYADFVKDLRTAPASAALPITGKDLVDNHLLRSADYFFRMWERIEAQRANVR